MNTITFLNMNSPTGTATIGNLYLSRGSWNPGSASSAGGGFTDAYTVALASALVLPLFYYAPGTSLPEPLGATWSVQTAGPNGKLSVPSDALYFDPASDQFKQVGSGVKATSMVTFNLIQGPNYGDGNNATIADLIYGYVIASLINYTNSSIYDPTSAATIAPSLQQVVGFKIVNSTAITVYFNYWYFDYNIVTATGIGDFDPLGGALPGGNRFPWYLLKAMADVVASGQAAWSRATATSKKVDWLSLVNPTDVASILSKLNNYLNSSDPVPKELRQLGQLVPSF